MIFSEKMKELLWRVAEIWRKVCRGWMVNFNPQVGMWKNYLYCKEWNCERIISIGAIVKKLFKWKFSTPKIQSEDTKLKRCGCKVSWECIRIIVCVFVNSPKKSLNFRLMNKYILQPPCQGWKNWKNMSWVEVWRNFTDSLITKKVIS